MANLSFAKIKPFYKRLAPVVSSGCVLIAGTIRPGGVYVSHKKKRTTAHRLAYELTHDRNLTIHERVVHTCDNINCVNPEHLTVKIRVPKIDEMVKFDIKTSHSRQGMTASDLASAYELPVSVVEYILLEP